MVEIRLGVAGGNGGTGGAGVTGKNPDRQLARMHVRVEHRHELVQIGEELVAEDGGVRGALPVADQRRLEHDLDGALDLDRPLERP